MKSMDYFLRYGGSVKSCMLLQYAYMRTTLHCNIDEATLDITGWDFFDILDGDISAPEGIPRGGSTSRQNDIPVIPREWEFYRELEKRIAEVMETYKPR